MQLEKRRSALRKDDQVAVFDRVNPPADAEKLGEVTVKDRGDGSGSEKAAVAAVRKAGGNVLHIRDGYHPPLFTVRPGKTWISGEILYVPFPDSLTGCRWSPPVPRISPPEMKRFEVNVGMGGEAFFATDEFLLGVMDIWYLGPDSAGAMHEMCYDADISATLSVEWCYNLDPYWSIVGSLGGNRVRAKYFNPYTGKAMADETTYMFDILVGGRYRYVHRRFFSVYSQVLLGANFHTCGDYWDRNETAKIPIAWQLTGLGLTFGNRLYGLCEFGWGSEYVAVGMITGARVGLGFKF